MSVAYRVRASLARVDHELFSFFLLYQLWQLSFFLLTSLSSSTFFFFFLPLFCSFRATYRKVFFSFFLPFFNLTILWNFQTFWFVVSKCACVHTSHNKCIKADVDGKVTIISNRKLIRCIFDFNSEKIKFLLFLLLLLLLQLFLINFCLKDNFSPIVLFFYFTSAILFRRRF